MAKCKYCGCWVAGKYDECGRCKRRAANDWRMKSKAYYNQFVRGKALNIK